MPQEEKIKYADYLVDTSDGFDATRDQVIELFQQLEAMSEQHQQSNH